MAGRAVKAKKTQQGKRQSHRLEPFDSFLDKLAADGHRRAPSTSAESSRIRAFLQERYAGAMPVMSRVGYKGEIYDYFRIEEQPAARKQRLKPATPPPAGFLGAEQIGPQFRQPKGSEDIAGLVPVRRLSVNDLRRAGGVDRFLNKRAKRLRSHLRSAEAAAAPGALDPTHRWADVWGSFNNTGAAATLNIWRPKLSGNQIFSLSQIWCVAQGSNGRQTAEVGWHVNPSVTGHDQPAIFCYWTRDGYATPTSYNGHDGDFLFHGSSTILGVPITDISDVGGDQFEVYCALNLFNGNWWLYVGGDQESNAVGYFPGTLYNGGPMSSGATEVDFGGEVCGGPPFAAMGSGAFSAVGSKNAAYQRNLGIWTAEGKVQSQLALHSDEADSASYSVSPGNSSSWGNYFYFGGPGGS
jgi:hypothetical protein